MCQHALQPLMETLMWWKLALLSIATLATIVAVIPIRTHSINYDPANPPERPSFSALFSAMYLTPASAIIIAAILIVAVLIGIWIARG